MKKKPKAKSRPSSQLPARHPKKTGKGMPPPEDPSDAAPTGPDPAVQDADQAAIDSGREAAKDKNEKDSAEAEQAVAKGKKGKKQRELLRIAKQPTPAIQNGRMSAHFIGFRAHRLKSRTKVVTMRFSIELQDEHAGMVPRVIEDEWKHFKRGSVKLTQPEGIGTQNIVLSTTPAGEPDLEVTANVPKAIISHVKVKGQGADRRVTRLEIHLLTSYTADVDRFCRNAYDETAWVELEDAQDSMGEEAGEDQE